MLCRIQTKSSQCSLLDSINSREPSICTSSMKTPQKVEYYSLNNEINTKKPKHRCTTKKKKNILVTFINCGTLSARNGER